MEWNRYPEKKPDTNMVCYVCNERWGGCFIATYMRNYDVFIQSEDNIRAHPCLHITHWVQLPQRPPLT